MSSFSIVEVDNTPSVTIGDGPNLDAFSRLRTSDPATVFDSKLINDKQPFFWDESVTGGGASSAYDANTSSVDLTVGTASGNRVIRQTKEYFNYQPGRSMQILMTGIIGDALANVEQRIGYFEDNDGLFFEMTGTGAAVVTRTSTSGSVVNNSVAQASWNLDQMDGTGPSQVTLDFSKTQIFVIDFQWLGAGRVRMGFDIDGKIVYCHEFLNANVLAVPYMKTPNLPLRYEIENTGTAASSRTVKQICSSVSAESGFSGRMFDRGIISGTAATNISAATRTPIISLRLKSANIRCTLRVTVAGIMPTTNDDVWFELVFNGALTGASFASVDANSFAEFDTASTAITGGEVLHVSVSSERNPSTISNLNRAVTVVADITGTSDVVSVAATSITGIADVVGWICFEELL